MKTKDLERYLELCGVPMELRTQAIESVKLAKDRSKGLLFFKLKARFLKAGSNAKKIKWENNRLIEVAPDLADYDIAPMLNITANGDNGPWTETPEGGRPLENFYTEIDPNSYKQAVDSCYWCKGQHPRSDKARKAWYKRNSGEYRAWRLGEPVESNNRAPNQYSYFSDKLNIQIMEHSGVWIVLVEKKLIGSLGLAYRVGFEIDNVFCGDYAPQMWYPIEGYELKAPVTWSVLPFWKRK